MVNFWLKIVMGKQSKIVKMLYFILRKAHYSSSFVSEWAYDMHGRLEEVGMEDVWRSEGMGLTREWIESSMKVRTNILCQERWRREV